MGKLLAAHTCELEVVELDDRPVDREAQDTHGDTDQNCKPAHTKWSVIVLIRLQQPSPT